MTEHHILVIDDDERLRILLRRFLEESGFRVTDAASAKEARQILQGMAFDILVVDIITIRPLSLKRKIKIFVFDIIAETSNMYR